LVTDGEETCGGDPVASAAALRAAGAYVTVIGFATSAVGTTASLNAIANAGAENGIDDAVIVSDEAGLSSAIADIITETILVELCNGIDDDCDLAIDEDFPDKGDACTNGEQGVCLENGVMVCDFPPDTSGSGSRTVCNAATGTVPGTLTEICNLEDDDCDAKVDEAPAAPCSCLGFEICNGVDDDCDTLIDQAPIQGVGVTCGTDVGLCEFGTVQCVDPDTNPVTIDSALACTGGVFAAPSDPCDGDDNDCDNSIDEDFGAECYPGATVGCTPDGGGSFNCVGICQSGNDVCTGGTPAGCGGATTPATEECNGIDDDCDGSIDENWAPDPVGNSLGDACSNNLLGVCEAFGTYVCPANGTDLNAVCSAPNITAGTESCDGLDNDCNGAIDDNLGSPIGNVCGIAGCQSGVLTCVDPDGNPVTPDSEIQCVGSGTAGTEVCNGLDDDCDLTIDEGIPTVNDDCYPTGLAGCTDNGSGGYDCEGLCAPGNLICAPPEIICSGHTGPEAEDTCDGEDNDCDGMVDEMADCPNPDETCLEGSCVGACDSGEFPCPFGFVCDQLADDTCTSPPCLFCLPDPCNGVVCEAGFFCDSDDGACHDFCEDVVCTEGKSCQDGFCVDCFNTGCPDGEVCVNGDVGAAACEDDPCFGVDCTGTTFCTEGECVALPTACEGVVCSSGQTCDINTGDCIDDECTDVDCPLGQICSPTSGQCMDAGACALTDCPADLVCVLLDDGQASCAPAPNTKGELITTGGGGGCSTSGSSGSSSWVLHFLLGIILRRRRR
jgi:uncharacterized protein (TIGR03382 family)